MSESGPRPPQNAGQPAARRKAWWITVAAASLALASLGAWSIERSRHSWFQNTRFDRIALEQAAYGGAISPSGRYLVHFLRTPDGRESTHVRLLATGTSIEILPPVPARHDGWAISPDETYFYYTEGGAGEDFALSKLYRAPFLGGTPLLIALNAGAPAIRPDGKRLAIRRANAGRFELWTIDPDGSNPQRRLDSGAARPFTIIHWSRDGKRIYYLEGIQASAGIDWKIRSLPEAGGAARDAVDLGPLEPTEFEPLPDDSGFILNGFDPDTDAPQIWFLAFSGKRRRITNDLEEYQTLTLTAGAKVLSTMQVERETGLRVLRFENPEDTRAISEVTQRFGEPVWMSNNLIIGSLAVAPGSAQLWSMNPDGSGKRRLPIGGEGSLSEPSACPGRDDLVFAFWKRGASNIFRAHSDGSNVRQLTFGGSDHDPQCLPDGSVRYRRANAAGSPYMAVSLEGGAPVPSPGSTWPGISPDGKLKVVAYVDSQTQVSMAAFQTLDGSMTLRSFPSLWIGAWSPDSGGIAHVRRGESGDELWWEPVAGHPRVIKRFDGLQIFSLNWSPDGRSIVCAVGRIVRDFVLISDVR